MPLINHLKGVDAQNMFLAVAYGKHVVAGHLTKSLITGASGSHTIKLQQLLGRGPWDGCEGLWFKGLEITPANYKFYPGIQSTGMGDTTQGQDTVFSTDTPHSGVAWIRATLATGVGDFDTKNSPPLGLSGIFRTMKIQDYDDIGDPDGVLGYSANPALEVADLILRIGGRPASRIHWPTWVEWRDFLAAAIPHDYTALPGQDGFGLRGEYYNGASFNTLVFDRIDPVIEFPLSAGSPGIGINVDNFSVRWEGKIKPMYTETYTLYITHDNGGKLWVNNLSVPLIDQWGTTGTHSATIALTAGQFYDIKVEWNGTGGSEELRLEWQSTSQNREVVSHRALYPKTVNRPRYETHPFFAGPTRLDDAVRTILNLCNSTYQEVDGKLRFFCLEQLATKTFQFTNDKIVNGQVRVIPRDVSNLRNSWQAKFRNLDSQYVEEDLDPINIERDALITAAGRKIDGEAIDLFNCNRHQAYRTLDNYIKRTVDSKFDFELDGTADTFQVLAGDRVGVDVEFLNWTNKDVLVLGSNDASSEETADERRFVMQEWTL
ncbi:MAG: hypothetical protein IT174_10830 [Acidobacteria bacterium]|nr:hypothetical protein [Acidobacteriota bacterium]